MSENILEELKKVCLIDLELKASNESLLINFDRLFFAKNDKSAAKRLKVAGPLIHNTVVGKLGQIDDQLDKKIASQVKLSIDKARNS